MKKGDLVLINDIYEGLTKNSGTSLLMGIFIEELPFSEKMWRRFGNQVYPHQHAGSLSESYAIVLTFPDLLHRYISTSLVFECKNSLVD